MKSFNIYLIASLCAVLFVQACKSSPETDAVMEEEVDNGLIVVTDSQFVNAQFMEGQIEMKTFDDQLITTGLIDLPSKNKTIISAYMGGTVHKMDLAMGHAVKKGERLFTLTNPEFVTMQQEYLEIESQMAYLKAEVERQSALAEEQISAAKLLAKAKADLGLAQAKLAGLNKKLSLLGINTAQLTSTNLTSTIPFYAPVTGYVTGLDIINGGFLPAASSAIEITNPQELHIELLVLENEIHKVKEGQKVHFYIRDNPEAIYQTTVHTIENQVNENRQIIVHCEMSGVSIKSLIPGMFVHGFIHLGQQQMASVPESAVTIIDGKSFILEKVQGQSGHQFKSRNVVVGELKDNYYPLIDKGELSENATILTKGAYYLLQ